MIKNVLLATFMTAAIPGTMEAQSAPATAPIETAKSPANCALKRMIAKSGIQIDGVKVTSDSQTDSSVSAMDALEILRDCNSEEPPTPLKN